MTVRVFLNMTVNGFRPKCKIINNINAKPTITEINGVIHEIMVGKPSELFGCTLWYPKHKGSKMS